MISIFLLFISEHDIAGAGDFPLAVKPLWLYFCCQLNEDSFPLFPLLTAVADPGLCQYLRVEWKKRWSEGWYREINLLVCKKLHMCKKHIKFDSWSALFPCFLAQICLFAAIHTCSITVVEQGWSLSASSYCLNSEVFKTKALVNAKELRSGFILKYWTNVAFFFMQNNRTKVFRLLHSTFFILEDNRTHWVSEPCIS